MQNSKKTKNQFAPWRFFASLKLTVVLLILLALTSIIGTFFPQGQGMAEFARGLEPETFKLFKTLGLLDMYHSTWFRILIGVLALNLITCSIDRFPKAWKRFSLKPGTDRAKPFEKLPPDQTFLITGSKPDIAARVGAFIRSRFKRVEGSETPETSFFYGEKGRYTHFGVYLVHLSVLIILAGGLVGSFMGFEAYVNIAEGEKVERVVLRQSMVPLELGFEVRCDQFLVDFYDNGMPKEFRSDLGFLVDGREVERAILKVNHPFQFMGVTFYQASYGTIPGREIELRINPGPGERKSATVRAEIGRDVELPGGEGHFKVADIRANLKGSMGPAVLIEVVPNTGENTRFWVFRDHDKLQRHFPPEMLESPILNPSAFKPYTFFLEEVETRYYTGLQVNRDPGVPLVWTGFSLMVAGFLVTFLLSHRRIWIRVHTDGDNVRISVAGTANKNPVGLERELRHLTRDLQKMLLKKGE